MNASFTRRAALKTLALGAALPLVASRIQAETTPTPAKSEKAAGVPFELGVASYSLRGLSLDKALQAVTRVGLKYISINRVHLPWENPPAGWGAEVEKIKSAGVTPRCCGVIYLKNDEPAIRAACEYARTLGVGTIACSPSADALPLLERYLRDFDLRAAIHNHGPEDKIWPTPASVWKAVQPFDHRIGLCIDVGHAYRTGADPAADIRQYHSRLYDIHLKDSIASVGAIDDSRVEIGRGMIDQRAILSSLREVHYRDTVWFEYEKDEADPLPGLAESVGYIKGLLKGMGAT